MDKIQEIARTLRSTEKMAAAFVKSVQEQVGPTASEEIILTSLQKLPPRSIEIKKVVAAVKKELAKKPRSSSRRRAKTVVSSNTRGAKGTTRATAEKPPAARRKPAGSPKPSQPKTLMEKLEAILGVNWRRAEHEGFKPERMTGPEFVHAVHRHCDPRDASRSRILRACLKIDGQDIVITPPIVADQVRAES
jgi:hypothetical protein